MSRRLVDHSGIRWRRPLGGLKWKLDDKTRAFPGMRGRYGDCSTMFLQNAIGDRQAQAGAGPHFFGAEERIENALLQTGWNARARVLKNQFDGSFSEGRLNEDGFDR